MFLLYHKDKRHSHRLENIDRLSAYECYRYRRRNMTHMLDIIYFMQVKLGANRGSDQDVDAQSRIPPWPVKTHPSFTSKVLQKILMKQSEINTFPFRILLMWPREKPVSSASCFLVILFESRIDLILEITSPVLSSVLDSSFIECNLYVKEFDQRMYLLCFFPSRKGQRTVGLVGDSLMLIRVLSKDKSRGFVEDYYLDDLIGRGVVVAFYRPASNEWIDVKNNHIRKKAGIGYKGPERRKGTSTLPSSH